MRPVLAALAPFFLCAASWGGPALDELGAQAGARAREGLAPASAAQARPAPLGVLIIGDSHSVGPFGGALYAALAGPGAGVALYAVCGASLGWWLQGRGENRCGFEFRAPDGRVVRGGRGRNAPHRQDEVAALLAAAPGTVVIALGANEGSDIVAEGAAMLAAVPRSSRCFWVAPPPVPADSCEDYDRGDFRKLLERMKARAGRGCELIDTFKYLDASRSSGCHFDNACGAEWGRKAAAEIRGAPEPPGACAPPH